MLRFLQWKLFSLTFTFLVGQKKKEKRVRQILGTFPAAPRNVAGADRRVFTAVDTHRQRGHQGRETKALHRPALCT